VYDPLTRRCGPLWAAALTVLCGLGTSSLPADQHRPGGEFQTTFTYRKILPSPGRGKTGSRAAEAAKRITRRDPSDVIRVGSTYYVWYTKTDRAAHGYDATVWFATSKDGVQWTEQGEALARGGEGQWDSQSVFTPGILAAKGKYYLFYTAVKKPFFNRKEVTAIGIALGETPDGPWKRFEGNPVLKTAPPPAWDSHRVDDSCLVLRDGKYWLYYKGRQMGLSPGKTKLGVALADEPTGPYVKHKANPIIDSGHEVLVWPHRKGAAALVTGAGPQRNTVQYSPGGIHFKPYARVRPPHAPGGYRPEAFVDGAFGSGLTWGVSHASDRGGWPYLVRFDCRIVPADRADHPTAEPMKLSAPAPVPPPIVKKGPKPEGAVWFDFESGDLQGWKIVEGKFGKLVNDRKMFRNRSATPFNKEGRYHLDTVRINGGHRGGDRMTGVVESPRFSLTGAEISFLVGGGSHADTYVALCTADGKEVLKAAGRNSEVLHRVTWDAAKYVGRTVFVRVVDRHTGPWGHLTFDDLRAKGKLLK